MLNLQKVTNCFNLQYFHISSNGCNSRLLLISKQWDKHIMWSDTSLLPKLDDVLETWKPMDAITLTNALISIHYWDDNWSFESALLRFIVCFIIYRPHKWEKKCLSTCNISKVSIFSWSSAEYFVIIMFKGKWFLKQIILFKTTRFCYRRTDWWWSPLLDHLHILKIQKPLLISYYELGLKPWMVNGNVKYKKSKDIWFRQLKSYLIWFGHL